LVAQGSVLFKDDHGRVGNQSVNPAYFRDLNLDQVVDAILAGRERYDLKGFFTTPLADPESVRYRQQVMRDLEDSETRAGVRSFSAQMVEVGRQRAHVVETGPEPWRNGWLLESIVTYGRAVGELRGCLSLADLESEGLRQLREYVTNYAGSKAFGALLAEAEQVKSGLASVRYSLTLQPGQFRVSKYEEQPDFGAEIQSTFEKFRQAEAESYLTKLQPSGGLNHIEAKILEFVVLLFPEPFTALNEFCLRHTGYLDARLAAFDREVQFYLAYLDFIDPIRAAGLPFCYPVVGRDLDQTSAHECFDLALAHKFGFEGRAVVSNDVTLEDPEKVIVLTGPNQGGKTTFARMFGQLHFLASLGCPVPGSQAQVGLFDAIHTHFERAEDVRNLRGKLQDDLVRLRDILEVATPDSLVIINEVFASTTLADAVNLSRSILSKLLTLGVRAVWVTFIDELASMSPKTVSMVSTVLPDAPETRTFKILRRPADGLAYAMTLAKKHRLTYSQIKRRIKP
jgi:DNA mismatch repair protein MutS